MAMDVAKTVSNLKNRTSALEGKRLSAQDWVEELLIHIVLLENICVQQQEEIDKLKKWPF